MIKVILALMTAFCLVADAQSPSLYQLLSDAYQLLQKGSLDASRQKYEQGIAQAVEEKDKRSEGFARRMLGQVFNQQARYAAASEQLIQSLEIFEALSDSLNRGYTYESLGYSAWGMGNFTQAMEFYRKSIPQFEAAGNVQGRTAALYNIAFVSHHDSDIEAALQAARETNDAARTGMTYQLLGDLRFAEGDFAGAVDNLQKAQSFLEEAKDIHSLARVFNSLTRVYRAHNQFEQALEFCERALQIQEQTGDRQGIVQTITLMGNIHLMTGALEKALDAATRALRLSREIGSPHLVSLHLYNLANVLLASGRNQEALRTLEESLRPESPMRTATYTALAAVQIRLGNRAAATAMADKAMEMLRTDSGTSESVAGNLGAISMVLADLGRSQEATSHIGDALDRIESLRRKLAPTDFMKQGFAERFQWTYSHAIDLLLRQGRPADALVAAEQARARAFLDLLSTREGSAPPPTATAWRGDDSAGGTGALSAAPLQHTAARLQSTMLFYWVSEENTFVWVVQPGGAIHSARVPVGEQKLRRLIRDTWAGVLPAGNRGTEEAWELPARGDSLRVSGDKTKAAWRELYRWLVEPVKKSLPAASGSRLMIVPHGPLFQLSFAALVDERGQYLLEKHAVFYAPAAAVMEFTSRNQSRSRSSQALFIGDPTNTPLLPNRKALPPLPGSRREVQTVSKLWSGAGTRTLVGSAAVEERVRADLQDKSVIHFATHGIVRDDLPLDSFLALGQSGTGSADRDGRLTAAEIYDLKLNADLVVLSACRTGLGKISGDGVAGLTRAFLSAGAASVVATLWDVADEPTVALVSEFYRSRSQGRDKVQALRAAQLRLLRDLRSGSVKVNTPAGTFSLPEHPVFWSGFVLQGEPR